MSFAQLGLIKPLLQAVEAMGYTQPTPIQTAAIPVGLRGADILGCAQTGTGKTASFTLPILQRLEGRLSGRSVRALILAPTRELAEQICDNLKAYGKNLPLKSGMVIGGVNIRGQDVMLGRGVDILVATPGRLLDHMNRGTVDISGVETFVLDEADRMLDMGFIRDIRKIIRALPTQRQTMMFSATLPGPILQLANAILRSPQKVEVARTAASAPKITQIVHPVSTDGKRPLLLKLLNSPQMESVIVFTRTKWGANKLTRQLQDAGHRAAAIHGNKSQAQRRAALSNFKQGSLRVLVATDIAARGIDVKGVSHVVNYELPQVPEDYVHRIGRTGRADASGTAVSLMSEAERPLLRAIERLTGKELTREMVPESLSGPSRTVHADILPPQRDTRSARPSLSEMAPPPSRPGPSRSGRRPAARR